MLDAAKQILAAAELDSVMAFGGEPLLYPEATCTLLRMAAGRGVKTRELITSGYFASDATRVEVVADELLEAGVNDIKLSVDAFHQETIPLKHLEPFIRRLVSRGCDCLVLHPSWVVSRESENEFNAKTRALTQELGSAFGLPISRGNVVTLAGRAKRYLRQYRPATPIDLGMPCGRAPYTNSPTNVTTVRLLPGGDVAICRAMIIGNVFHTEFHSLLNRYDPYQHPFLAILLASGIAGLHRAAAASGRPIPLGDYCTPCDLCADCVTAMGG